MIGRDRRVDPIGLSANWRQETSDPDAEGECQRCGTNGPLTYDGDVDLRLCRECQGVVDRRRAQTSPGWRGQR